jgi:hypothetical protein
MITVTQVPSQSQGNTSQSGASLSSATGTASPTTYVFDAVLELDHEQAMETTNHPVQTGASLTSHAYLQPATVTMSILMSDVVQQYSTGQQGSAIAQGGASPSTAAPFSGNGSKSVAAYQTLLSLQSARQPLTVTTRLRSYQNMMITAISPREDHKTITGLRVRVTFKQIITGAATTAQASPVSARPDATQITGLGTVNPSPVPASTQNQFGVTPQEPSLGPSIENGLTIVNVPGAGNYSSEPGQTSLPSNPNE